MEKRWTISERLFAFIENGIFLSVFSVVAGLVGVFVYGPVLTICTVFVALALHRSKAISDLIRWHQAVIYLWAFIIFGGIFYGIGTFIESHRDHIPTVREIMDATIKTTPHTPSVDPGSKGETGTSNVPPPHKHPPKPDKTSQFPIHLIPKTVTGGREVGDVITVALLLKNVSDHVVDVENIYWLQFAHVYDDQRERDTFEENTWQTMINQEGEVDNHSGIPSAEGGLKQITYPTPPLSDFQSRSIKNEKMVVYLMVRIRDHRTKKTITEFCGYVGKDNALSSCSGHNLP
jgi:hypothetical protein